MQQTPVQQLASAAASYALTTAIVMERCEGTLEDQHTHLWGLLHNSSSQGLSCVVNTLVEVAVALEYLHDIGIVHGDLKCSNILCQTSAHDIRGYSCKVSDFGLSQ